MGGFIKAIIDSIMAWKTAFILKLFGINPFNVIISSTFTIKKSLLMRQL